MKYVRIEKHDSVIKCVGIYNSYYYAVGEIVLKIESKAKRMERDGFKLVEKNDLYELDGNAGIGWYRKYSNDESGSISESFYYLFKFDE